MYGKCGYLEEAINLFSNIKFSESDIVTWNTMISVYRENGKGREALICMYYYYHYLFSS
jgi:hypothetical protein